MVDTINPATYEQIVKLLTQLHTNYSNMASVFYDIFYNPAPKNVTFEMFDESNVLRTYTIKNLALSNQYRKIGNVEPEGKVPGAKGTMYQDLGAGEVYIKQSDSGNENWQRLVSKALLDGYIMQGNVNPNGIENEDGTITGRVIADPGTLYVDTTSTTVYICTQDKSWQAISINTDGFATRTELNDLEAVVNTKENEENKVTSINEESTDVKYPSAKAVYRFTQPQVDDLRTSVTNLQTNKQDKSNLVTSISSSSTDTQYPSAKAAYNVINTKQDKSNLVTSLNAYSTNTEYPSARCVYNALTGKADAFGVGYGLQKGLNISGVWTPATQNSNLGSNNWQRLAYGKNIFVALGYGGYISTSTDGTDWILAEPNNKLGSNNWQGLAYGGSKFVALGESGYISTSTNGTTWTTATQNSNLGSHNWQALAYGGGKFVALGFDGYISTSTNGTTWTTATQNSNLEKLIEYYGWDLAYGKDSNGRNIFVALSGGGYISTSTDGETWTLPDQKPGLVRGTWVSISYSNNSFVALDESGWISTSTDGETWTLASMNYNLGSKSWRSVTYGNNEFVALSGLGHISIQPMYVYPSGSLCVTNTLFDGSWENYRTTLSSSNLAIGTYDLSSTISSYLPNDGYYYEVEIFLKYESKVITSTTVSFNEEPFYYGDSYGTSNQECKSMRGSIIINPNRTLSMQIEDAKPAVLIVTALRYRRLGTNV